MNAETHSQIANFIWSICNLLRGPYKRNEYRKVILPLTVLRRFDCLLAPTKAQVLAEHPKIKAKPETVVRSLLEKITERPFYNLSKLDLPRLLDDPNQLAPNLNAYINGFSPNVRAIMERFAFDQQIAKMAEKNLLYEVVKAFAAVDLWPERVDNIQMGYV
ncbi:MAG TPA: type I restriction-modification system subunit M N-terminal domain-containing protein, partial [Burkholderiales bacterium]|nr:type I restriction-modification system subunit M N-terminal domain-containing protein [Burkholderiales bacterium]